MRALSRWLSRFSYNHPNFSIPGLMKYIAAGNVLVYLLTLLSKGTFVNLLTFVPARIFHGEIWRLVTFVFVPIDFSPISLLLSVILYYYLGSQLENVWGSARFTVYYLFGVLLTILGGLLTYLSPALRGFGTANMYYVNLTLLLAFATLYPDLQFMLFYIIPIKAKWLAWFDVALLVFDIFSHIGSGHFLLALIPILAIFNYLIFFWDDLMDAVGRGKAAAKHRSVAHHRTIDLNTARKQMEKQGYIHKCSVCGITDTDHPNMEFRYCSRCNGYYCYCEEHISNHTHIQ